MKQESKLVISLTMFDMLKGVGMLTVIFLHSIDWDIQEEIGWKMVYSVLMPAFFITSGYWLKPKSVKDGMKAAAKQLLKPYLISLAAIEGIGMVHRLLTGNFRNWLEVFFIPGLLGMSGPGTRFGPLWFLLALFWAWIMFYCITKLQSEMLQIGAAVLAGVIGGLWIGHQPPFQLSQGLIGFSFLYGGYFLKKKKWLFWRLRFWEGTLMGVVWFLTAIIGTMDLGMYEVRWGFFSVLGSFLGAALLIRLFLHLEFLETLWAEGLRTIGRYTMWILCVHGIEGAVIPWNFLFRFVEKDTWMGCVCWFFLRLIVIGVCCVALEQWKHMCMKQILRERQGIK